MTTTAHSCKGFWVYECEEPEHNAPPKVGRVPYYSDELVTIYHGDALTIVGELSEQVACVITDPPYSVSYKSGWVKERSAMAMDGTRLCLRMYRALMPDLLGAMQEGSHFYWFTRWDVLGDVSDVLAPYLPIQNVLVWDKGHPGMGDLTLYGYSYEMAVFAMKGKRALTGGRPGNIVRAKPVPPSRRHHMTEKPVELLSEWVGRSTLPGETVLDPFMGSGSTLVAARSLDRKAIGIEIEERYCEIAARRCSQEVLGLSA